MADRETPLSGEVFRPYEKLVEITILGKTFLVPERNSLLRAFQFISPETVPYGRFCWNQECQYCKVNCQLSDEDRARPILSCKFIVSEGMEISNLSPELVGCLRTKLGAVASNPRKLREADEIAAAPAEKPIDVPAGAPVLVSGVPTSLPSDGSISVPAVYRPLFQQDKATD
ncbi:MAG TPA: hypothetical protein VG322_08220 [Candidatus Acidoferrales bacterium]|jgi:hypothetical protein|nr:hypothetical protein [Candidatus Acidoferrales bacterium]